MEPLSAGDLVTIATGGAPTGGIVMDVPSDAKVIVAMMDRKRGPVLRTVDAATLTAREDAGSDDHALTLLIRRTPRPAGATTRGGSNASSGRAAHTRAAMHRTTGK